MSAQLESSLFESVCIGAHTHILLPKDMTNADSLEQLGSCIEYHLDDGEAKIVLDFEELMLINSAFLECLLELNQTLNRLGSHLKVSNVSDDIGTILRFTGLAKKIEIFDEAKLQLVDVTKRPVNFANKRLGEILVEKGIINNSQLQKAIEIQQETGQKLGEIFVQQSWLNEHDLLDILGQQTGFNIVELKPGFYDVDIGFKLEQNTLKRLMVLPLFLVDNELFLATSDPYEIPVFDELAAQLDCTVTPVLTLKNNIEACINDVFSEDNIALKLTSELTSDGEEITEDESNDLDLDSQNPVVKLVSSIIHNAISQNASDIHIEPGADYSRVRFRVDGILTEVMTPESRLHAAIISRLKVMANLDISEKRLPQDGRIQLKHEGHDIDLRFSSLPGLYGEKIVLRILDKSQAILDIERLGMSDSHSSAYKRLLKRSDGLFLVTGPTGSGKTTSLYAGLNHINSIEKNIVTIEDPIEYRLPIINQNQVKNDIGLNFPTMLKSILRQDPDIVMVGEIRDIDTAEIAIQASLTGHLVLSTLHTNDSISTITRLIDMGIEPYLLSSALNGVLAQRLVRLLCSKCKKTYQATPEIKEKINIPKNKKVTLFKPVGCGHCNQIGYQGRMAIHELIESNEELQKLIMSNPSRDKMTAYMQTMNIQTLYDSAISLVMDGFTSLAEVERVVDQK